MKDIEDAISFIDSEMDFYSYSDFYNNAALLKNMYNKYLTKNFRTKKLYCWYVYSRNLNTNQKNMIWEYLNNDIQLGELSDYYMEQENNNSIDEELLNLLGGF